MPSSTSSSEVSAARARLLALGAFVLGLLSLGLAAWLAMPLSPVSSQRYLAAIDDKIAMLERTKGEEGRIILIGGSGAAFSISAEELTKELDRPVYNAGLQATAGLRNLVDLYAPHLDPHQDLVVLLPEPQMLASDDRYSQTWCDILFLRKDTVGLGRQLRCVPMVLWRTWQEGQHHWKGTDTVDGVYRRSGFNAFGDLTSHLDKDRDPPDLSDYDHPQIPAAKLDTIIDEVGATLSSRGVRTLYVPAAMPAAGCKKSPQRIDAMAQDLARLTTGPASAPDVSPHCLGEELFFDGAGHLNARGREIQTAAVAAAIERYLSQPG